MKTIRQRLFSFLVVSVAAFVFAACSNEQITSLDEDAITQDIIGGTQCEVSSLQVNNSDYEVIPVGANNYVYVPKMTSAKSTTRSVETTKMYSASIKSGISSNQGYCLVTVYWNNNEAYFRLSDGYSYTAAVFTYRINGSSIDVQLSFKLLCNGINIGDFDHSGILQG